MVQIRTPANQRIFPLWNTQALADAIAAATGATNFGTYLGHSPTAERAIDAFTTIPMPRSNRVLGDRIADYVLTAKMPSGISVWDFYGIRYIIWRQHINWNDGNGWIAMADRGDDTQNHLDHDHISTNVIPRPTTIPAPPGSPSTTTGGNEVLILNVKDTGIFLLRGSEVGHLQHPDHVLAWVKAGVPYQDKVEMPFAVFSAYTGWGQARGFMGGAGLDEADEEAQAETASEYEEMREAVQAGMQDVYDEYVRSLQVQN